MSCAIPLFVLLLQRTTQETNFIFSDNCSWTFWRSWELIKQWKGKRLPLPDFTFLPFPLLHWMEPDSLLCPISLYFFTRVQVVLNGWNRSHSSALPDFTFLAFTLLHWMEPDSFLCTLALNRWNQSRSSAWFHLFTFVMNGIGLIPLPVFTFTFFIIALYGIGLVPVPEYLFTIALHGISLILLPGFTFFTIALNETRLVPTCMSDFTFWLFSPLHWMQSVSFLCLFHFLFYLFHYCTDRNRSCSFSWFHLFTSFTIALNGTWLVSMQNVTF